jgi:hypothetical protein
MRGQVTGHRGVRRAAAAAACPAAAASILFSAAARSSRAAWCARVGFAASPPGRGGTTPGDSRDKTVVIQCHYTVELSLYSHYT